MYVYIKCTTQQHTFNGALSGLPKWADARDVKAT